MALNQALLALEKAAAIAAQHLPDEIDDEQLLDLIEAFWPSLRGNRQQRIRQGRLWLAWIADAGDRWPASEPELTADELHQMLVDWCRRT